VSILHPKSLKWRLIGHIAIMQAAMLALLGVLILTALGILWRAGILGDGYEGAAIDVLAESVEREADGGLKLTATPELTQLRLKNPDLWFVVRDDRGHRISEGSIPREFASVEAALNHLSQARLTGSATPGGIVKWVDTKAGKLQMLSAAGGRVSVRKVIATAQPLFLNVVLPIIGVMTIATLLVTPFVVRRATAGLEQAADDAERIDIDRSGLRLSVKNVPAEIIPFVKAVNCALDRLDAGYERHKRFLTDAAHELRTPIAILTTRISSLPASPERTRLLEDTTRLTILTGQLLDLQRLDHQQVQLVTVDLVDIAERVVLDLAPLAFAAGYEMSFEPEAERVIVQGDETALERALSNLVQNAIDHGGRRGTILVRVARAGWIEVCDDGDGIPTVEREQVFEPFHRLKHEGRGAGLGLDLVQKIMRLHNGEARIVIGPSSGACIRMVFRQNSTVPDTPGEAGEMAKC